VIGAAGHHAGHGDAGPLSLDAVLIALAALAVLLYAGAMWRSRRAGRGWPVRRLVLWTAGVGTAAICVVGPLATAGHDSFVAHTWAHLLGGMLAPLLLVLAMPVTLTLRSLAVTPARRLSRLLRSGPGRFVTHPVTALVVSAGGLWLLYFTPALNWMQASPLVHVLVQAHLLVAGFLFTAAVIDVEPRPHPSGRVLLVVVLVLAMASHSVLAKFLYAYPPAALPAADVRQGAELMFSLGGLIEAVVITIFCARWYTAAGRARTSGLARSRASRSRSARNAV